MNQYQSENGGKKRKYTETLNRSHGQWDPMRPLIIALLLSTLTFAGCISDAPEGDGDDVTGNDGSDTSQGLGDRRFEPKLIMETPALELEQGQNVSIRLDITDLHDYSFPMTFIDWNLTYHREPNPVLEGDATQVPATYERTLFAEDWHLFKFNVDDGQGFKQSKHLLIKVGNPPPLEVPVEEIETPDTDDEVVVHNYRGDITGPCTLGCFEDIYECQGWATGVNNQDCYWFDVDQSVWGAPFTQAGVASDSDVDTFFYTSCDHTTPDTPDAGMPVKVGSEFDLSGTIPLWTGCVVMFEFGGPLGHAGDGTLSMEITVETPFDGDPWVDRDADGVCHAVEGVYPLSSDSGNENQPGESEETEYVHDRTPPGGVKYVQGGGIWLYEESNGIPGLQIGSGSLGEEAAAYTDCVNPDFLVF